MLLSINWLNNFIQTDCPVNTIADRLTMAGIEVDNITDIGRQWDNIVTGEILEITSHPNADKLSIVKVKAAENIYSVVCGAPNIKEGQKIVLALEGALFSNGMKIRPSKIRGQNSDGMICSEKELELGEDTNGIMVLPQKTETGILLAQALNLSDTIFDLGITPNRSDCFSIIGIAREVSAIFNIPLSIPEFELIETAIPDKKELSVEIKARDLCHRYTACLIDNITVRSSPLWMRRRLETCGIRPINNIVDITNYVLLEWGQPLHAFDLNTLNGGKIIVRKAEKGETFLTLDGIERIVPENVCLICDSEKPVALGGIMGGASSGISSSTSCVLLESAYFSQTSIARSSRALNLKTEASHRFERGVDMESVVPALNSAASLLAQIVDNCRVNRNFIDCYPQPAANSKPVFLSIKNTNKIIGSDLNKNAIEDIMNRLQIKISEKSADTLCAIPPSFRHDLHEPVDLIEEVARINGYDRIPVTYPKAAIVSRPLDKNRKFASLVSNILISLGYYEVINYSFISPDHISYLNFHPTDSRLNPIKIINPLSSSQAVLRTSIVPGLLLNLKENLNNKAKTVKIFELGKVFYSAPDNSPPAEPRRIAALLSGNRYNETWNLKQEEIDFYDIKGAVETLLNRLHITSFSFKSNVIDPYFNQKKMLSLFVKNDFIGTVGTIQPGIMGDFEIENSACVFDLDYDKLLKHYSDDIRVTAFSKHPAIYRDLALLVDKEIFSNKVIEIIKSNKSKLIKTVDIFDYYTGNKIPPGKKSLAYKIKFQSPDRTLTDIEVNKICDRLLAILSKEIGAELRP